MTTIEMIWGPDALKELAEIPLTPLERSIGELMLEVYADGVMPPRSTYDPLPSCYRKVQMPR